MATSDVLARARRLLAFGFSIIPVPPPRPGVPKGCAGDGKTPILKWGAYQTRVPTDDELQAWFGHGPTNIAIITGALSGVVVIDCDDVAAVHWWIRRRPYTPWQTQTANGFHLFYRHPGVAVSNRARIDTGDGTRRIDVRGDGGFVIAPGSIHASGFAYREAGDWSVPRAQLPTFWPGWLARPPRPPSPTPPRPRPTGDVIDRARRYLAAVPPPVIGQGSDAATLYAACRLVRGFGLSTADAEDLLWHWAGNRPGWSRDWIARKVANAERFGSEPIGALR